MSMDNQYRIEQLEVRLKRLMARVCGQVHDWTDWQRTTDGAEHRWCRTCDKAESRKNREEP